MVVVLAIKDTSHSVVGLFFDLVGLFHIYVGNIKFFGCYVCFNFALAWKRTISSHKVMQLILFSVLFLYFQAKTFPLILVLQNDAIIVLF